MPDLSKPAFPTDPRATIGGISAREWFAGQALVAIHPEPGSDPTLIAQRAFRIADAMLAESKR